MSTDEPIPAQETDPGAFAKRLTFLLQYLGITSAELARSGGVGKPSLTAYLKGETTPKANVIGNWVRSLGVNANWLLSGKGDLFGPSRGHAPALEDPGRAPVLRETARSWLLDAEPDPDFSEVPLREATGTMGGGSEETGKRVRYNLKFRTDWLRDIGGVPGKMSVIRAFGESMSPTILDDSVVLIDEGRNWPVSGKVFYVRHEGKMYIKRLFGRPGALALKGDNEEGEVLVREGDDFEIIGQCLWTGRKLE